MTRALGNVLDRIVVVLALAGFAALLVTIAIWVAQPDLIIVLTIGFAMAAWDFWVSALRRRRDGNLTGRPDTDGRSLNGESSPSGRSRNAPGPDDRAPSAPLLE